MLILFGLVSCLLFVTLAILVIIAYTKVRLRKLKKNEKNRDGRLSIGIFHPFSSLGSSEERILWEMLRSMQNKYPDYRYVIYSGDIDGTPEQVLSKVKTRLNLSIDFEPEFIYLHRRYSTEYGGNANNKDGLKLAFNSFVLAFESLFKFNPDIYLTINMFTIPIFKYFGGSKVCCYINMISPEILLSISNFKPQAHLKPSLKYIQRITYAKIYTWFFTYAGKYSDVLLVNSTWTEDKINNLINCPCKTFMVYPPCPIDELKGLVESESRECNAGPIKLISNTSSNIPLTIRTLFLLRQLVNEDDWDRIQLTFAGKCHSSQESERLKDMEDLCKHLSVENNVSFKLNLSYEEYKHQLQDTLIGIHTKQLDPFSISLVEYMGSGVIGIANNSGGTRTDITVDFEGGRNAFLASDELDYAEAIKQIILMRPDLRMSLRERAHRSVQIFSEEEFKKNFLEGISSLFQ